MGHRSVFAWVLNLDAELEMAEPSYCPRARVLAQLDCHGQGSLALLAPGDVLLDGPNVVAPGLTGRAWSPTPRALARMAKAGAVSEPHPPLHVLRTVNHRNFAVQLARGLPDQHYVQDRAAFDAMVEHARGPQLVKRAYAFAGRGQLRVFGKVDAKQSAWVDASLRRTGLVIEPLVQPTLEVSLHGFIWRDARCEMGRVCVQDVSDRGVFRSIRLAHAGELSRSEEDQLFSAAAQTALALANAGYFGPFGIDGYRYLLHGQSAFCALGEINARYTMGFVTGFPRHPSEIAL